ncbi:MAG: hypothetical protein HYS12_23725 [Planctomycetes bacterium]|nr:hypothetical protein [Planctomycetota bacterium]
MQALRGLVVSCAVLLLAGQVYGDPTKDDAAKLLIGKWETKQKIRDKEATAILEFTKDGKLNMKLTAQDLDLTLTGSYKLLDEKTLELTVTVMDKTRTEKQKFKVSKDTLELIDKEDKSQKFNRTK